MLERIREGAQGPWAMVVIALIVLSFVFAGVGSYLTGSTETAVASVNGVDIQQNSLENAYQNERARIEGQFGEGVAALFANPEYLQNFRQSVLERLIGEELVEQKAIELGLRVSDDQIRDAILVMPEFQVGGQFNNDRFQAIIQQAGFKANTFRDFMRAEMSREQLARALAGSEFALPSEAQRANDLQTQQRDLAVLNISAQPFTQSVEVSPEDIDTYYQANIDSYDTDERVALSFIELKVSDLTGGVEVTADEVMAYYQQNQQSYLTEEERRVSHILVELGDDEAASEATAQALLDRVNAGEDFATLAEQESADTFSAENGGDLDFFGRDIMDPAFEEAAFGLASIGDVSGVVRSDFGFHIIKLTDMKPEVITPLEDVQADIESLLLTDKATEQFYVLQQEMARIAFEVPDTLEEVAIATDTQVQTTALFTENNAPANVNFPQVVAMAFSSELIDDAVNSDVIEIDDDHVMVIRVSEHEPQRTKTLEEVSADITQTLTAERAQQAALDFADVLLAKLSAQESIDAELSEQSLEWQTFEGVTRNNAAAGFNVVEEAFTLGTAQGQNIASVAKDNGDVAIVRVDGVTTPELSEEQQLDALRQRLASNVSQTNYQAFIDALRSEADVTVFAR